MSLSTEIDKIEDVVCTHLVPIVLNGKDITSLRGIWSNDIKALVSDLARLMETREPDREELILILNRIGLSNSNGNIASGPYTAKAWDKFIDALLSWATTGGTRKRVTREQVDEILDGQGTAASGLLGRPRLIVREGLADKIMALLDPEPSKRWCEHIEWRKYVQGEGWIYEAADDRCFILLKGDDWKSCPICGAPRPS